MPRVQENAFGILPSRSISRGSRISTITTSSLCAALIASSALMVSISALASSTRDLIPRWMVWGIFPAFLAVIPGWSEATKLIFNLRCGPDPESRDSGFELRSPRNDDSKTLPHQFLHRIFESLDRDRVHAV